jgi:hypothetical protein
MASTYVLDNPRHLTELVVQGVSLLLEQLVPKLGAHQLALDVPKDPGAGRMVWSERTWVCKAGGHILWFCGAFARRGRAREAGGAHSCREHIQPFATPPGGAAPVATCPQVLNFALN